MPDGGAAAAESLPVSLERVHVTSGRARFRARKDLDRAVFGELANRIAAIPGITRVVTRPNTGSVIVYFEGAPGQVLDRLGPAAGVRIRRAPRPPPAGQALQFGLMKLDMDVRSKTEDTVNLRTLIALLLLFTAIIQLSRGQLVAPASTLAFNAFQLLDPGRAG